MNRKQRRASIANGKRMMKSGWTEWQDITAKVREIEQRNEHKWPCQKAFMNAMYIVQIKSRSSPWGDIKLLMIRRNDESSVHKWTDLYRIKNELAGKDATAVEVYPSENDLVDSANMYHLWVMPEGFILPFGLHL